jgi:purine-binding chemotaxis protein CheW
MLKERVESEQYLIFKIGDGDYGLDLIKAREIIKPPKITTVPNSKEYVMGVINLRGQIIPVIDLMKILGLEKELVMDNKDDKRIIVVNLGQTLVGLFVNKVTEVVRIDQEKIERVAETKRSINQEYIKGVCNLNNQLIVILNLGKLLSDPDGGLK